MRLWLVFAATWALVVAPALCRSGLLDACCKTDGDACAGTESGCGCVPDPAAPAQGDCNVCADVCGAVAKPTGPIGLSPIVRLCAMVMDAPQPAPSSLGPARGGATSFRHMPNLPFPPSDLPLLI